MKHLIHIGYPKAASTFLQEWFSQHPEFRFNHGALGSFYNIYDICREAAQNQQSDFKYFVTSSEDIVSPRISSGRYPTETGLKDYTQPGYQLAQIKVCRILKDLFPNSEILLITRGFKRFYLSCYSQYVRCGGVLSWENFSQKYSDSNFGTINELFDYDHVYKLYARAFGEENLIVLPYELLCDDRKRFFSLIEERLGVEHFDEDIPRLNESLADEEIYWYPRISYRVSNLAQKLGPLMYEKIYALYIHQTNNRRIKKVARLLSRWRMEEDINQKELPPELLQAVRGKAEVFLNNPLYAPYLSEYLLDK
jgi:hypothetical protein